MLESYPREQTAESSIEALTHRVRATASNVRSAVVQLAVEDASQRKSLDASLEQQDPFFEELSEGGKPLHYDLANDVAVGIAPAASALPSEPNNPLSVRESAARCLLKLTDRVGSTEDVSRLRRNIIRECTSFAVSSQMVLHSIVAEGGHRALSSRSLDVREIRRTFDNQVMVRVLSQNPSPRFDFGDDDIFEMLYRTEDISTVTEIFGRWLGQRPQELARFLRLAVVLYVVGVRSDSVSALHNGLPDFRNRVDLQVVDRITRQLPTDFWHSKADRALATFFCNHYEQAIIEAEQRNDEQNDRVIQSAIERGRMSLVRVDCLPSSWFEAVKNSRCHGWSPDRDEPVRTPAILYLTSSQYNPHQHDEGLHRSTVMNHRLDLYDRPQPVAHVVGGDFGPGAPILHFASWPAVARSAHEATAAVPHGSSTTDTRVLSDQE